MRRPPLPARIIPFALAVAFLQCVPGWGQIQSTAETCYIVDGIDGYEVVAGQVLAPATSKPVLVPVGLVTIDCEAAIKRVKAEDATRKPVRVDDIDGKKFLVRGRGQVWVEVTCVDFEKQIFEQSEFVIEIGEAPEPPTPPEPDKPDQPDVPDVPDAGPTLPDGYPADLVRLAKELDTLADVANLQFDLRQRVAESYSTVAAAMESREILRTSDAVVKLGSLIVRSSFSPEWQPIFAFLDEDAKARPGLSFAETIRWYVTVAAGFKG